VSRSKRKSRSRRTLITRKPWTVNITVYILLHFARKMTIKLFPDYIWVNFRIYIVFGFIPGLYSLSFAKQNI
jgi:hypothetical protein